MISKKTVALALVPAALSVSLTASAQDEHYTSPEDSSSKTLDPVRIEGLIGYGVHAEDTNANAFGVGLGIRAGYVFPKGFYLGGTYVRHLGESESLYLGPGVSYDVTAYIDYFAAELGYEFQAAPAVALRPYGALGTAQANVSADGDTESSDSELMLMLGFALSVALSKHVYLGGDVRYLNIVDPEVSGLALFSRIGGAF